MRLTVSITLLAVLACAGLAAGADAPRKPHLFAPSLPELTDEEEAAFDKIIDDFILYDVGALKGEAGKKALEAFNRLPPEAIFALIRGMNRAAAIEDSCPAVVIGKKIASVLRSTTDEQLLDFARENLGAGVKNARHVGVIKDLKVACILRKRDVDRLRAVNPRMVARTPGDRPREMLVIKPLSSLKTPGSVGKMSIAELAQAAELNRGTKLQPILIEIEKRDSDDAINALAQSADSYEKEIRLLARDLLVSYLSRQSSSVIKKSLKDGRTPIRIAAAKVVGKKGLPLGASLIELLSDEEANVREAAHDALVKLAKGVDFGPESSASPGDRDAAVKQWQAWWAKQSK